MTADSDDFRGAGKPAGEDGLIVGPARSLKSLAGLVLLWVTFATLLLFIPKIVESMDSLQVAGTVFEHDGVMFVMQCMLAITGFVGIGFAGVVPLLWFQRASMRCIAAIVAQSTGWILFMIGVHYPDSLLRSLDDIGFETCVFLTAAMGGFLPVGFMIWMRRWRLSFANQCSESRPIGIFDFLILMTVGAAFIAYQRHFGVFSSDPSIPASPLLIVLAYSGIGATMTASLLVTTRVILGPRKNRFNAGTMLGILVTLCLALGVWIVVIISDGTQYFDSPVLECITFGGAGWLSAALTSIGICLWLRQCGVRLSTSES